jgi:hypothetical protein
MSAFPTFPRGKPITNEEARAAVETELFAMKLTKPMTPAEKDAFCEIAKSRLNYESNSYRIKEIRLWVESWESLWLPVIDRGDTVQGARSKRDRPSSRIEPYIVTLPPVHGD